LIESHTADDLGALLDGAATVSRAGDHAAAVAALSSAAAFAPDDLKVHRRLAAAYAVAGDLQGARREYLRFVTRLALRGATDAAATERSYAEALLIPRPATHIPTDAAPRHELTEDQAAIAATVTAMIVAGAQIFASAGAL
jgi:DNA-binding SARP family transcriptional activator